MKSSFSKQGLTEQTDKNLVKSSFSRQGLTVLTLRFVDGLVKVRKVQKCHDDLQI